MGEILGKVDKLAWLLIAFNALYSVEFFRFWSDLCFTLNVRPQSVREIREVPLNWSEIHDFLRNLPIEILLNLAQSVLWPRSSTSPETIHRIIYNLSGPKGSRSSDLIGCVHHIKLKFDTEIGQSKTLLVWDKIESSKKY